MRLVSHHFGGSVFDFAFVQFRAQLHSLSLFLLGDAAAIPLLSIVLHTLDPLPSIMVFFHSIC